VASVVVEEQPWVGGGGRGSAASLVGAWPPELVEGINTAPPELPGEMVWREALEAAVTEQERLDSAISAAGPPGAGAPRAAGVGRGKVPGGGRGRAGRATALAKRRRGSGAALRQIRGQRRAAARAGSSWTEASRGAAPGSASLGPLGVADQGERDLGQALPAARGAVSGESSDESNSQGAAAMFDLLDSEVRERTARGAEGNGKPPSAQDPALSREFDRMLAGGSVEFAQEALFNMVTKREGMSTGRSQVRWKNLSRDEELELGTKVQALMAVGRIREELKEAAGGVHSDVAEWAKAAGLAGGGEGTDAEAGSWALAQCLQEGHAARRYLLVQNLRLVTKLAYKYRPFCQVLSFDDLCSAGLRGLIDAVDTFDPTRGFKFSTHGFQQIRFAISNSMYQYDPDVKVPKRWRSKLVQILKKQNERETAGANSGNLNAVADDLEMKPSHVSEILRMSWLSRLDKTVGLNDDGSATTLGDLQEVEDAIAEGSREDKQLDGMLNQLLSTLQPHEAEVLRLRYGLDNGDSHSQQEVSNILQIHSHTVKRYEHSALQKMRHPARAGRLSPYTYMKENK